jgi:hypothetical protein
MLGCPAEFPYGRLALSFQNGNIPNESSNPPAAVTRLLMRDLSQDLVWDALDKPRSKQRGSDEPVANILAVRQLLYLRRRAAHGFCRYQRTARRGYEFFISAEVPCPNLSYWATPAWQTSTQRGQMAAGARGFVEMDAKPFCRRLDFPERCECGGELFFREKTILRLETLSCFLGPSIRAAGQEGHKEHDSFEKLTDHLASKQKKP